MKFAINHFLQSFCARPAGSVVIAVLVALMALQVAAPPRLAGFDSKETYEEFEEEGADPSESDGEQCLPEFVGPVASRPRRPDSESVQKFAASIAHPQRGLAAVARPSLPAELAHRNGIGGPLRC
jgi:hypothetical protein